MIPEIRKKQLEKQQYRLVGNHSAIKICLYCKKSIRGEDVCYKNTFFGIKSWRCVQMSPVLDACTLRCQWCWRDLKYTAPEFKGKPDKPADIVDGCIEAQKEILQGFKGNPGTDRKRFDEAMNPLHFAISLTAEPTLYPKLPQLIDEIHSRGMTTFLVTNGTNPGMLKRLLKHKPTQLYVTLPAPDKETFMDACKPLAKNAWESIQKSLRLLEDFDRTVVRLTLAKEMNMLNPAGYAEVLKDVGFKFVEPKAAMPIGYARHRMKYSQMPLHQDILEFSEKLAKLSGLKVIDQKKESRVCLLAERDWPDRKLKF